MTVHATRTRPAKAPSGHDRGLQAVQRVREVNESAALLGLQQAIATEQEYAEHLTVIQRHLDAAAVAETQLPSAGTEAATVIELRMTASRLLDEWRRTRIDLSSAAEATRQARSTWEAANTRLAAVDELLERRRAQRRAEQLHKLAKEADDIAAQGWLRRQHLEADRAVVNTDQRQAI